MTSPQDPARLDVSLAVVEEAAAEVMAAAKPRPKRQVGLWLAIVWLSVVVLVAVFADVLPLFSTEKFTKVKARTAPGLESP